MAALRQGAAVFFVNGRGEVLLRLRDDQPGLAFPDQWDTIGGAVEAGESHPDTAVRGAQEEIGVVLTDHVYWRDYQSVVLLHIYAAPLDIPAENLILTEGQRVAWFSLAEAMQENLHSWVRAVLTEFMQSAVYRRLVNGGSPDSAYGPLR